MPIGGSRSYSPGERKRSALMNLAEALLLKVKGTEPSPLPMLGLVRIEEIARRIRVRKQDLADANDDFQQRIPEEESVVAI